MGTVFYLKFRTSWTCITWCRWKPLAADGLVRLELNSDHWRHREGFQLTDAGTDLTGRWIRRITASSATTRAKTVARPA